MPARRALADSTSLDRRAVWILGSSIALYALSLALPALDVLSKPLFGGEYTPKVMPGAVCVAFGWIYLPGWLANPLLLAATICHGLRRHRIAIVLLSLAVLSALAAPLIFGLDKDAMYKLVELRIGYYLWLASLVVMLVGASRSALRDVDRRFGATIDRPF